MRLSKRELIMLILLIIVAVIFIEYRFVIIPGVEEYDRLMSEKQAAERKYRQLN
jgi:cell division protein FtsL